MAELAAPEKERQTELFKKLQDAAAPAMEVTNSNNMGRSRSGALSDRYQNFEVNERNRYTTSPFDPNDIAILQNVVASNAKHASAITEAMNRMQERAGTPLVGLNTPQDKADKQLLINAIVEAKLEQKKIQDLNIYLHGAAAGSNTTAMDPQTGQGVGLVTNLMGIDSGFMGMITNMLLSIGPVGDYVVAAFRSATGWVGKKFGMTEPGTVTGFNEVLQEIRDAKTFGGGVGALGLDATAATALTTELKLTAAGGGPKPAEDPNAKLPKVLPGDSSGVGLDELKKIDLKFTKDEDTARLKKLQDVVASKADKLGKDDAFVYTMLPDGKFALITGALDPTGTKVIPAKQWTLNEKGDDLVAEDIKVKTPLQTSRQYDVASSVVRGDQIFTRTMSENLKNFQGSIDKFYLELQAKPDAANMGIAMSQFSSAIGINPDESLADLAKEVKKNPKLTHVLAVDDAQKLTIVTGEYDAKSKVFTPKFITQQKEGSTEFKTETYKRTAQIKMSPPVFVGTPDNKTLTTDPAAFANFIQAEKKIGDDWSKVLSKRVGTLLNEKDGKSSFMLVTLPGGNQVIVKGELIKGDVTKGTPTTIKVKKTFHLEGDNILPELKEFTMTLPPGSDNVVTASTNLPPPAGFGAAADKVKTRDGGDPKPSGVPGAGGMPQVPTVPLLPGDAGTQLPPK